MAFNTLALREEIVSALTKLGYHEPTEVQSQVIPLALEGKNLVVQSHTGSGKTAAFVIPALNSIDPKKRTPQVLILEPTRELAMQTRDEVFNISRDMRMGSLAIYGGSPIRRQIDALRDGPQVIVATPGRLIDLVERRAIRLEDISVLVLDEVDQMMDMGFAPAVKEIWRQLSGLKQVMTFSATYTREITSMLDANIRDGYESLILSKTATVDSIDHVFMRVGIRDKYPLLKRILERFPTHKTMVFTARKHETEELERYLHRDGFSAAFIHGDMFQRDRINALKAFKEGNVRIFIGTDVASRGLNMNNINLVVNYHVPHDPESYIHRIGRTGRAGADGHAIMLVSSEEDRGLARIERMHKIQIKEVDPEGTIIPRAPRSERSFGGGGGGGGGRRPYRGGGYRGGSGSSSGYRSPRPEGSGGYQGSRSSGGGYQGSSSANSGGSYDRPPRREGGYQGGSSSGGYSSPRPPRREGGYQGGGNSSGYQGRSEGGYSSEKPARPPRPEGGYRGYQGEHRGDSTHHAHSQRGE